MAEILLYRKVFVFEYPKIGEKKIQMFKQVQYVIYVLILFEMEPVSYTHIKNEPNR